MTTAEAAREDRLTIGAVCRRLQDEFPDVSISKIRYLEDQGLLTPRRTRGGYRLFAEDDVERLRTILRLQRDEFLPLRVIRQELSSSQPADRKRRRPPVLGERDDEIAADELCRRAGVTPELLRELESYGLLEARMDSGGKVYPEGDVDVAAACAELARFGLAPRHLRPFRTSADRKVALLGQLAAPGLRSRNAERRQRALDDLRSLAEVSQRLSQQLFWRALRRVAA
ncbi:MAG: MerR family transcriptional regulator [Gaiellaceae bacterium]